MQGWDSASPDAAALEQQRRRALAHGAAD